MKLQYHAMIIVMKNGASVRQIGDVIKTVERLGFKPHVSRGQETTIIGVIGDERALDPSRFSLLPGIEKVIPILKPFKLASRDFKQEDTKVKVGRIMIGEGTFTVMSGPCAVESKEQLFSTAKHVKKIGANILRGGAFKPRTSPYSFQGMGVDGLKLLREAADKFALAVVTEVMSINEIEPVVQYADILQIGARNMQNFRLLEAAGKQDKPVLLKRGMSSTMEEFLLAAEYILSCGNRNVILCERGIRTFERYTRNTLDISAVPVVKKLSHLPIIVDPSHACGQREYVAPLALSAIAAGADGLIIEVHPDPDRALSDGQQSLNFPQFKQLMHDIKPMIKLLKKRLND